MKKLILSTVMSLFLLPVVAVEQSAYSGQQTRQIKALSEQQVIAYLNGKGLGYAKAAELNQYPGPSHVLALAQQLDLNPQQIAKSQAIFDVMQQRASSLGQRYVEMERLLDQQFSQGDIDAVELKSLVSQLGHLQSQIRYVHLVAHLEQRPLLTKQQLGLYDELRGYSRQGDHKHGH